ncbi:MAG: hypothetical protein ACE5JF_00440 [Anaerolineales bacterium]
MTIPPTSSGYADAQLDDYSGLKRSDFPWTAPATLRLQARASHPSPPGTLGFGYWNDPFGVSLSGAGSLRRLPAPPQAMWFFHGSPPNDFTFADGGAGSGWKAATLRSIQYPSALLVPGAAVAFALGNLPLFRRWIVPLVRKQAEAVEVLLDSSLTDWHEYGITWRLDGAVFEVDGEVVAKSGAAPHPPLGFVAWIDNQYAVFSETKGIRFGLLPTYADHWLEIQDLHIERF